MTRSKIKFLALDVDGTLTDGGLYISETGDQLKRFNVKDGMAITECLKNGVEVGIISSSTYTKAVQYRADMLGIKNVAVGKNTQKLETIQKWCKKLNITLEQVAFIGDDINDIEIMNHVGVSACPSDAAKRVIETAKIVLETKGGYGCVREFYEQYILGE